MIFAFNKMRNYVIMYVEFSTLRDPHSQGVGVGARALLTRADRSLSFSDRSHTSERKRGFSLSKPGPVPCIFLWMLPCFIGLQLSPSCIDIVSNVALKKLLHFFGMLCIRSRFTNCQSTKGGNQKKA